MKIIDYNKSILENLYLLSGPLLAIFGFYIFRQIKLAKEQINIAKGQLEESKKQLLINSKRDSIKLAVEQMNFYAKEILAVYDNLNLKTSGVVIITVETKRFIKEDLSKYKQDQAYKDFYSKINPHLATYLEIINHLEVFSTYFTQKVADENIAFQSIGQSVCNLVNQCSCIICMCRDNEHDGNYSNLVKLYNLWNNKLQTQGLQIQKETLENEFKTKLEKVNNILKDTKDMSILPLGTN